MASIETGAGAHMSDNELRSTAGVNDALLAVGRVLIAVLFLVSGFGKAMGLSGTASYIASKGLPMPDLLAMATVVVELGGGILIVIGWQTRIVALILAVFTLAAAYFFHDFWNQTGAAAQGNQIHALKNLSIAGGFLMLAAVGAGRYSLDGPCVRHRRA
jgi:putative oxidoreductase